MSLTIKIVLFIILTIISKYLSPPSLLYANVHSVGYFFKIFVFFGLAFIESYFLALIISHVFTIKRSSNWIVTLIILSMFVNLTVNYYLLTQKARLEIEKHGILWRARVEKISKHKGGDFVRISYRYGSTVYQTPSTKVNTHNKNIRIGDSINIIISKRNPAIYDIDKVGSKK